MSNPVYSMEEFKDYMASEGVVIPPEREPAVQGDLDAAYSSLVTWLNRDLVDTRYVDERVVLKGALNRIRPKRRPVKVIESIRYDYLTGWRDTSVANTWDTMYIEGPRVLFVTYVTDASEVEPYMEQIRAAVRDYAAKNFLTALAVKQGVITSYSVEGTSITYGSTQGEQRIGVFPANAVSNLGSLKVRRMV